MDKNKNTQPIIFLVLAGAYTDVAVQSVWSTRELADAEVARHPSPSEDWHVEEFRLDQPAR